MSEFSPLFLPFGWFVPLLVAHLHFFNENIKRSRKQSETQMRDCLYLVPKKLCVKTIYILRIYSPLADTYVFLFKELILIDFCHNYWIGK